MMDNETLKFVQNIRDLLVNALREINSGHLRRAKDAVDEAFGATSSFLIKQEWPVKVQGGPGSTGIGDVLSQGAAGPPGHSTKVHHVGPGIYREGPGLSLEEARDIQRAAAGGGRHPGQTGLDGEAMDGHADAGEVRPRYAAEFVGDGSGGGGGGWHGVPGKIVDEHGRPLDIQVRKPQEWEMNLAKVTQARYIADLITMKNWVGPHMSREVKKRIHGELMKEVCAFDDRLEEEDLKDG